MVKWLTITLIAVVAFITILLGLGYLLKEHEISTTQLKRELDQERAQLKAKEARKQQQTFETIIERTLIDGATNISLPSAENLPSIKQKILVKNLTCTSVKQCVLVDINFADLECRFAVNTIGASLLAKSADDLSSVGKCPSYPQNSQLSCLNNICSFGSINN
jgi:hypothetical protein